MNKLTIAQIQQLMHCKDEVSEELLQRLAQDSRVGVRKLYEKYQRQVEKEKLERVRVQGLYAYETRPALGNKIIAGVDEVGRGPLAGPVYAAAVILPRGLFLRGLNDSKKLALTAREELARQIKAEATWSIAYATVEEIDKLNILNAAHLAMLRALRKLTIKPDLTLVDGNSFPQNEYPFETVIDGDSKCACIAAASIIAKVERDRVMSEYDRKFPFYGFGKNKGYGTAEHCHALQIYGPCQLHRKGFLKKVL